MIKKLPIIDAPIGLGRMAGSLIGMGGASCDMFRQALHRYVAPSRIYLANSGTTCLYLILKALAKRSPRKEVILPAYTAGNVVVAVRQAGLRPVLCGIKFSDFNMDAEEALKAVCGDTLAVVAVHMFGVGMSDIGQLAERLPQDVFLIEDCAQSMGTSVGGKLTGSFGDASFFSFNRGKNLPLGGGGCIATEDEELAGWIEEESRQLKPQSLLSEFAMFFKSSLVSLALNPYIYGMGYVLIAPFKSDKPVRRFAVRTMGKFTASCGLSLIEIAEGLLSARQMNAIFLADILKDLKSVTLPATGKDSRTVFNRMPILFKDGQTVEKVRKALRRAGIESSRMYFQPLHHMFNLGYMHDEFPNACYFAERVLTLPIHPSVTEEDLLKMADVIINEAA
ncbi:MAG: DegT/DnrJ/EryC1/StrS family aminotransferase [Candidatus Omnitrophica bacterium]|nr:DegT/DnrJ/EryC1/StrS family aminotransferase [Candidatus Omnitrophota bacterium]